LNIFQFVMIPN